MWLAQGLVTLVIFGLASEVIVRWAKPTPRAQIIRGGDGSKPFTFPLRDVNGQPVWEHPGSAERQDPDCAPDATQVLMMGSSILWGTGYAADEVVSHELQVALNDGSAPWCVRNYAQPGFQGFSKTALATEMIDVIHPKVVVWEVWSNDGGGFRRLGDDAYGIDHLVSDEAGYPVMLPFLPNAVRAWLFHHSAAWEYAALALTPRRTAAQNQAWRSYAEHALPAVADKVRAQGGEMLLVFMPWLNRPFADSAEEHRDVHTGYRAVRAWAEANDVPWVDVAEQWVDAEPEPLRNDPCCHYNPAGHTKLAELLEPRVRALLPAQDVP